MLGITDVVEEPKGLLNGGKAGRGLFFVLGARTGAPTRGDGRLIELRRWPESLDPGRDPFIGWTDGGPFA